MLSVSWGRSGYLYRIDLWNKLEPTLEIEGIYASFSPDSKYVLTTHGALVNSQGQPEPMPIGESALRIWNIETGQLVGKIEPETDYFDFATFSPGGKYILASTRHNFTAGAPGTQQYSIWDAHTLKKIADLGSMVKNTAGIGIIHALFTPDDQLLLAQAHDLANGFLLIDPASGLKVREFVLSKPVVGFAIAQNGTQFFTTSYDSLIYAWDIDYHSTIEDVCKLLQRDFSAGERLQYDLLDKEPTCPEFGAGLSTPESWTPIPTQPLPRWTPMPSPTVGPSPTSTPYPTPDVQFPASPTPVDFTGKTS